VADKPVIHFGEYSPERVAHLLMSQVFSIEKDKHRELTREKLLDTYAECLEAVLGRRTRKSEPSIR
jgi:hypothetical protein